MVFFPQDTTAYGVNSGTTDTMTLGANMPAGSRMLEHYKLAWTSYALVCENGNLEYCGDLYLYYNFSPTYAGPIGTISSLLLKDVEYFKFKGAGRTTRIKICKKEKITQDVNISACKEKAVF